MKKLLLSTIILVLCACNIPAPTKKLTPKKLNIEVFVNDFINRNPDWNKNDILREEANAKFKKEALLIIDSLISDYPLELTNIKEYAPEKYSASFRSWYSHKKADYNTIAYRSHFDVVGIIRKSLIDSLETGKKYLLTGDFIEFIPKIKQWKKYMNTAYTPNIGLHKENYALTVDLGVLLFKVNHVAETDGL